MSRDRPFGVSVVIPSYGRPEALLRAVDSVRAPRGSPVEIIVVDDATPPGQRAACPLLNAQGVPVRSLGLASNSGPQSARNLGMRRARFRFVAFLDSDDQFTPDKVEVLLDRLAADDVDLLFHAVEGIERFNGFMRHWIRSPIPLSFRWLLAVCNPISTPALVVRRQGRLGIPRMRHCEDWAFLLHYCAPGIRVAYLDRKLCIVARPQGTRGGLSESFQRMRRGEFKARRVLLRKPGVGNALRWALGQAFGYLRVCNDLLRGRYGITASGKA